MCADGHVLSETEAQPRDMQVRRPTHRASDHSDRREGGCTSNSDCGEGQVCRKGKCVKKPPVTRRRTPSEEQTSTESTGVEGLERGRPRDAPSLGPVSVSGVAEEAEARHSDSKDADKR